MMPQIEHKIVSFDVKSSSATGQKWDGHANAFFTIDSAQEIVAPGAFTDTIAQFLDQGFIGGLNHNWDDPIGRPVAAKEDTVGLWIDALCDVDSNEARKCSSLIQKKIIKKLSIGYRVKADEYLDTAEDVAAFWKEYNYSPTSQDIAAAQFGARVLTRLHLFEASPVTVPANNLSDIDRVKRYDADTIDTERQFEKFLRDAGFAKAAAKTICVSGFKALRQRDVEEAKQEDDAEKSEPPPNEPDSPDASPIPPEPEAQENEKQEPPTEVAPVVIADPVPVVEKADSRLVSARFANFLTFQARLARV